MIPLALRAVNRLCAGAGVVLALVSASARSAPDPSPANAEQVLKRAEEVFQNLQDYECLASCDSRLGRRTQTSVQRMWFKKPNQIRLRVVKGAHRGSEVAIDARRKVRGHEGGLLKPIVIGVRFTDSRLKGLRGNHISELDWGSFYRKLRERMALPGSRTTVPPRPDPASPYEVTVTYPLDSHSMREVYRFDPRLDVMQEGDVFEDGVRVDHISFTEIKLNTGLEDKWFRL